MRGRWGQLETRAEWSIIAWSMARPAPPNRGEFQQLRRICRSIPMYCVSYFTLLATAAADGCWHGTATPAHTWTSPSPNQHLFITNPTCRLHYLILDKHACLQVQSTSLRLCPACHRDQHLALTFGLHSSGMFRASLKLNVQTTGGRMPKIKPANHRG